MGKWGRKPRSNILHSNMLGGCTVASKAKSPKRHGHWHQNLQLTFSGLSIKFIDCQVGHQNGIWRLYTLCYIGNREGVNFSSQSRYNVEVLLEPTRTHEIIKQPIYVNPLKVMEVVQGLALGQSPMCPCCGLFPQPAKNQFWSTCSVE